MDKILAEMWPEEYAKMQEQIKQLKEPISQDDAGDAPDRWSKLTDRLEKAEALAASRLELLRRCRDAIASQAENLIEYEYYKEAAQFEDFEKELAEELGDG